jgi:hypothetical protein
LLRVNDIVTALAVPSAVETGLHMVEVKERRGVCGAVKAFFMVVVCKPA